MMSICAFITLIMAIILITAGILFILGLENYGNKTLYLIRIVIVLVIVLIIVYLILFLLGITTLDGLRRLLNIFLPIMV